MNWFLKWRIKRYINSQIGFVTPREIARKFLNYSAKQIADALFELKESGFVNMKYKIVKPDGDLSYTTFYDPRSIPKIMYDKNYKPFNTASCDIIPILERTKN
jgi:hypothetical protein